MLGSVRARVAVIALLACFGRASTAPGASFAVNSVLDAADANPGDGSCATAGGLCTLRAAIQEANALPGADDVTLPAGTFVLSIAGRDEDQSATGDLDLHGPITITGQGATATIIDAGRIDRVFDIWGDASVVTIQQLTVRNGFPEAATFGGGIFNSAMLTLTAARVEASEGPLGGGGIINDGDLTATDVSLVGNKTSSLGGGLYNTGTARLERVTVSGNTSAAGGAGIANDGTALTLLNVTISGNVATTDGGGLYADMPATLQNVTIAANGASRGGGVFEPGDLTFGSTIVAANTAGGACFGFGTVTTLGSNLDDDGSCSFTGTGDLSAVAPGLGPLGDNGGPTQTHLLLPGSPAIDAAASCPPPATDQRGTTRPQDGNGDGTSACDIGAVEITPPVNDTPLAGTALVLTDNASNAAKRKLVAVAKDKAAGVPSGVAAPESVGAELRVVTTHGDAFDATYALPASGWKTQGRAGHVRGHKYADTGLANGPISAVVLKSGKLLKIVGRGAKLEQSLAADPEPVWIVLTIGNARQCMSFGGAKPKFAAGKRFTSHGAPRPAGCNPG